MPEVNKYESEFFEFLRELPFDDTPRPEHGDAQRERVLRDFDQARASKTADRPWKQTLNTWKELMRRPIPRLVAVTIVFLSIAAPWLVFPGHQSTASAFDNFATALVEAKTARFQTEVTVAGLLKQKIQAYYLAPGRFRQEMTRAQ
jgi:hypothetical protein